MLIDKKVFELMRCWPGSCISYDGYFVAAPWTLGKGDAMFCLNDCETNDDLKYKVIAYLSRAAYKTEPWSTAVKNRDYQLRIRRGLNKYLGTAFTADDMCIIYTLFGNGCNEERCRDFIKSGYDMNMLVNEAYGEKAVK